MNIFCNIHDIVPLILKELSLKDLSNISKIDNYFNNEIKDFKRTIFFVSKKFNIKLYKSSFYKWSIYTKLKKRTAKNVCSWSSISKSPEREIILF